MMVCFIFYVTVFHWLSNLPLELNPLFYEVHTRFWLQPNLIAFSWMSLALEWLAQRSGRMRRLVAAVITLTLVTCQVMFNYRNLDHSNSHHIRLYGLMHLEKLPPNSVLLVKGDIITNSIRYLQRCEGLRPDVQHLDQAMMTYNWFVKKQSRHFNITFPRSVYHPYKQEGYSMEEFLDANLPSRAGEKQTNCRRRGKEEEEEEEACAAPSPFFLCGGWYHDEGVQKYGGGIPGDRSFESAGRWGLPAG